MRIFIILATAAFFIAVAAFWSLTVPRQSSLVLPARAADLANGKTIFQAGGCAGCHAVPEQDDPFRLGGGQNLKSPFGTFYVPNISPHPRDGIGGWGEAQFVNAMADGVSPDRRHYFPAFPYTSYRLIAIDDLRDLFAYLKTLPSVDGRPRDHQVPFPFNIRRAVGLWKWLFFDGEPFRPDPSQSAQWNRGAYLVNGPGHCAECHSPRNALGGVVKGQRFAGGRDLEGEGWVPNITQAALGGWSLEDFQEFLETGLTPRDRVSGRMREVIRNISQLSAADRTAMAVYLKSLPAVEGPRPARQ